MLLEYHHISHALNVTSKNLTIVFLNLNFKAAFKLVQGLEQLQLFEIQKENVLITELNESYACGMAGEANNSG